jgi:hypothetical protein
MKNIVPFKRSTQDDDPTLIQTDEERSRLLQDITESTADAPSEGSEKGQRGKHLWKDIFG